MPDLIDKQDAIVAVHHAIFEFFSVVEDDGESPMTYHDKRLLELNKSICTSVKALPTADVVERKKGKWIDPAAVDVYRCSICEEYTKLEVPRQFYHYCPNCGSEMEGGEDG